MRILFLSRYQNTSNRGVETFVTELVSYLSKKHEVDIFSGKDSDNLQKIIKGKYDVVIPTNGRMQSLKVCIGRFAGEYKVLISGHAGIGKDEYWDILFGRPDVFIALTSQMEKWAKKFSFGIKVVKIPNGVDLNSFKPEGEKINSDLPSPVVLSVGALTWYKHHEKAIQAVSGLDEGSLLIVGKGEDEKKLQALGEKLLPGRFKIMQVNYSEMPKLYRSVDLFTLPSWDREAFGIVYLEAMASNVAVVAPNDDSRKEIVGEGGILVDVDDQEKYTQTLEKALQSKWGNKPREQAEKFSWEIIGREYEKVLEGLIDG